MYRISIISIELHYNFISTLKQAKKPVKVHSKIHEYEFTIGNFCDLFYVEFFLRSFDCVQTDCAQAVDLKRFIIKEHTAVDLCRHALTSVMKDT